MRSSFKFITLCLLLAVAACLTGFLQPAMAQQQARQVLRDPNLDTLSYWKVQVRAGNDRTDRAFYGRFDDNSDRGIGIAVLAPDTSRGREWVVNVQPTRAFRTEAGKKYRLMSRFTATSDGVVAINMQNRATLVSNGLYLRMPVKKGMNNADTTFTALFNTDSTTVQLDAGGKAWSIIPTLISLEELTAGPPQPPTTNRLANPGFENGYDGWIRQGDIAPHLADFSLSTDRVQGVQSAKIRITENSLTSEPWRINIRQVIPHNPADSLSISFWANASTAIDSCLAEYQTNADFNNLGLWKWFKMERGWKKYEFRFRPNQGNAGKSTRVQLNLAGRNRAGVTVLLDSTYFGIPQVRTAIQGENEFLPKKFTLEQNYPNPFNPSTTIQFYLRNASPTHFTIYDLLGGVVVEHQLGTLPAGDHTITWDGKDSRGNPVGTGIYFYNLVAGEEAQTRRMTLMR